MLIIYFGLVGASDAQGVFHVELKYTSRGPRLIEVNCRMGGGPVRNTNLLVWGVDLVEEQLMTSLGIPACPPVSPKPLMHIAEYSINADKSGYIENTEFLKVITLGHFLLSMHAQIYCGNILDSAVPTITSSLFNISSVRC